MPTKKRFKTRYPGVVFIEGEGARGPERIYYILYRNKEGKLIEEKAGKQHGDAMTPSRADKLRTNRIEGREPSNKEKRRAEKAAKEAEAGKWTIDKLWKKYSEAKQDTKSGPADKSRYQKHIKPSLGEKEPHEVVPLDIDRLLRKELKGMSDQTKKHVLALLRRIINFGIKKRLSAALTFALEMPSVDNTVTETLTREELSRLLTVLNEHDDVQAAHIMLMALYTGMRKGELLKLTWEDIDFERGFIRIRQPKGGRSQTVPLNAAARAILEKHPRQGERVFVSRDGKPFKDIRKRIEPIRKAAKLPDGFRPMHGLRHVYASLLANSGKIDMYTLQRLLTHKSAAMTQRYAHLRDEALRAASDLVVDLVNEGEN